MPDAYLVALVLASALFLYVVYQRIRNGQPITTSLLYIPLLLAIAFVFYKLWADGQKIAKLQSEVEKGREREKDLKMKAQQGVIDEEVGNLEEEISTLETRNRDLEEQLKVEEKRHEKAVERARSIESWDDFWTAVGPGDEGSP